MRILTTICVLGVFLSLPAPAEEVEAAPVEQVVEMDPPTDEPAASADELEATVMTLSLEEAKRIALEQNPSLEAARMRVQQAHARARQAFSAYLPRVNASASGSKTWLSQNALEATRNSIEESSGGGGFGGGFGGFGGTTGGLATTVAGLGTTLSYYGIQQAALRNALDIDETTETYSASVSVSWLVFDGLERRFTHLAAKYGQKELDAAHAEAQRLLLDGVARTYFFVQLAVENLTIAKADEAFNERLLKDAEARLRVGTGSLSDELNFRVGLNAARNAVINAELDRDVSMTSLAQLLAMPEGRFPNGFRLAPLTSETPPEMAAPDVDAAIDEALTARPDLQRQEYAVDRADATRKARRGPFFPSVTARYSQDAQVMDEWDIDRDDFNATAAVSVDYEIFAGGFNKSRLEEAKFAKTEAEYLLHETENAVIQEVREANERVLASQRTLVLQRLNAQHARQNRDLTEKEYNAGQGSLTRLNQAQRDLLQAQASLALARVSLRSAWHQLGTATAATLDPIEGPADVAVDETGSATADE